MLRGNRRESEERPDHLAQSLSFRPKGGICSLQDTGAACYFFGVSGCHNSILLPSGS